MKGIRLDELTVVSGHASAKEWEVTGIVLNTGPTHEGLELPRRWGVTRGSSEIVTRTPGGKPPGVFISAS